MALKMQACANWPSHAMLLLAIAFICGGATTLEQQELLARQAKIELLSPAEKQQLERNEQRFAALAPAGQNRLRKLADDLESDPAEVRLKQVLARYHEWLKTLTPGERAELLELPIADRVERIKEIKERQARHRPRRPANLEYLTPDDLRKIARWVDEAAWTNRDEIIKSLGPGMRERLEQMSDEQEQRRFLAFSAWGRSRWSNKDLSPLLMADTGKLIEQLSPQAAARLRATPEPEQRALLKEWLRAAFIDRMDRMGPGRKMPLASNEEIEAFFEKSLSATERERLLNMPRDEMQRELRRRYVQYSMRPEFPPSRIGKQGGRGKNGRRPGDAQPPEDRRPPRDGKQPRRGPGPDGKPPLEDAKPVEGEKPAENEKPVEDSGTAPGDSAK